MSSSFAFSSSSFSSSSSTEEVSSSKRVCLSAAEQASPPLWGELVADIIGKMADCLDVFGMVMMVQTCKQWQLGVTKVTHLSITDEAMRKRYSMATNTIKPVMASPPLLPQLVNGSMICQRTLKSLQYLRQNNITHLLVGPNIPSTVVTYLVASKPKITHLTLAYDGHAEITLPTVFSLCSNRLISLTITHDRNGESHEIDLVFGDNLFPSLTILNLTTKSIKYISQFKWATKFPMLQALGITFATDQHPKDIGPLALPHLSEFTLRLAPSPDGDDAIDYDEFRDGWKDFSKAADSMLCHINLLSLRAADDALPDVFVLARPQLQVLCMFGVPLHPGHAQKLQDMKLGPNLLKLRLTHIYLDKDTTLPISVTGLQTLILDDVSCASFVVHRVAGPLKLTAKLRDPKFVDVFDLSCLAKSGALHSLKQLDILDSFVRDPKNQTLNSLRQSSSSSCHVTVENSMIFT